MACSPVTKGSGRSIRTVTGESAQPRRIPAVQRQGTTDCPWGTIMNPHKLADELVAALGGLYGDRTKFFREGSESPHVSEVVAETQVAFPRDTPIAEGEEHSVPAAYGTHSAPARFTLLRWQEPTAPTLIYHHGSGESKYTARIRRIAAEMDAALQGPDNRQRQANIIACSVPYNSSLKEYLSGVGRLDRFVFMLAAALNFEGDFESRGNQNVYPLMARFDQFIRLERQSGIYRPEHMSLLDRGHTTGSVAYKRLGNQLAAQLQSESPA